MAEDHTTRTKNAMLMAKRPLEATLGQCLRETLTTLGVAGYILGGKVHGLWPMGMLGVGWAGIRVQTSKVDKQEKGEEEMEDVVSHVANAV